MPRQTVHGVADYLLSKLDFEAGDSITNLKLQKLVYYVQGWHLGLFRQPAFDEKIEAWARGPVVPVLWRRFRDERWGIIEPPVQFRTDPVAQLSERTRELIDEVWDKYGDYQGHELEAMTHKETPWLEARGDLPDGARSNAEISQQAMRRYFRSRLAK